MKINIKELINYTKFNTLKTINLNNLELDLCLDDGEKPTAEHIFNALNLFHDYCIYDVYEDIEFIKVIVFDLENDFFAGDTIEDDNLIFAVGKYNNKDYLMQINIDLSGIEYGYNPMKDADGNTVPGTFNYKIEVDRVWDFNLGEQK